MAVRAIPNQCDPTLLADIRQYGKFDTSGCYQCGSCTLSCDLVTDSASFPRKSIRYALLGLREPLLGSLEPWICHDCGECSDVCPREAEPRTSMATLRRFLSAQYDWTGIASRLLRSKAWYVASLVIVAVLTVLLIGGYHIWLLQMGVRDFATNSYGVGPGHVFMGEHPARMTYFVLTVTLLPFLLLLSRVYRIWRHTMGGSSHGRIPVLAYLEEIWVYVYETVFEPLMQKCPKKGRWLGHWMLALGTSTMLAVKIFGLRWFQTDEIYPIYNPQRWVGYLAFVFILYGLGDVMSHRLRKGSETKKEANVQDYGLPVLLLLTALTGLAAHILRYTGFAVGCHFAYALHVIFATPMLLVEMSFGKWAHMIYRPLALYFQAVRDRAEQWATAREGASYAD